LWRGLWQQRGMPNTVRAWTLRKAREADAPKLAELKIATWKTVYKGVAPDEVLKALDAKAEAEKFRKHIAAERENVLVAESRDGLIGYAVTAFSGAEGATGELVSLYVLPASIGAGVGQQLFDMALTDLAELGAGEAFLWVLEANARARAFYEHHGFKDDGGRKECEELRKPAMRYRRRVE